MITNVLPRFLWNTVYMQWHCGSEYENCFDTVGWVAGRAYGNGM